MTQLPSFVDLTTLIILVNFINPKMVSSKHPMLGLSVSPLIFKLMVSMDLLLTPVIIHPLQWSLHQSITLLLTGNDISFIDNLIHQLDSFRCICPPAKLSLISQNVIIFSTTSAAIVLVLLQLSSVNAMVTSYSILLYIVAQLVHCNI